MRKVVILAIAGLGFIAFASADAAELVTPPASLPGKRRRQAEGRGSERHRHGGDAADPAKRSAHPHGDRKGHAAASAPPRLAVFIANPGIADVQVKVAGVDLSQPGKTPGDAVVYAVDSDDNVLLHAPSAGRPRSVASAPIDEFAQYRASTSRSARWTDRWCSAAASPGPRAARKRHGRWPAALTMLRKDQPIVSDMSISDPELRSIFASVSPR